MLNDGLSSTLNGELILHGILVISGKTVVRIFTSEYFSNNSETDMLEDVLPIVIRRIVKGLDRKGPIPCVRSLMAWFKVLAFI